MTSFQPLDNSAAGSCQPLLDAVIEDARFAAEQATRLAYEIFPEAIGATMFSLPKAFVIELGAIARIARLQDSSLASELGVAEPSWTLLRDDLVRRFRTSPESFCEDSPAATRLSRFVNQLVRTRMAWGGIRIVGTYVRLDHDSVNLDTLDRLADILWGHRQIVQPREEQHGRSDQD